MWRSQSSIGTTHRPPWTSLLANSKRVFRFAKYVANSATLLACRGQLRVCVSDGLIKSERLNVAAEFPQRVQPFRRAGARIAHEIIEAVFPCNHDKMRDSASQPHAHDHGISVRDVRIDQLIRRQVFVN